MGPAPGVGGHVVTSVLALDPGRVKVAVHEGGFPSCHFLREAGRELQALSVAETCLRWNPDGSGVVLWPNVAFLPKVLSPTHLNQPIRLARFDSPSEEGRSALPGTGAQGLHCCDCEHPTVRAIV